MSLWVHRRAVLALGAAAAFGLACHAPPGAQQSSQATQATAAQAATGNDSLFLAAARAALPPAGITEGDLPDPTSEGAKLVAQFCTDCHNLPTPPEHSATEWPTIVRRMWLRMDIVAPRFHISVPSTAERVVIMQYLIDNALKVVGSELPAGPGREEFAATCSTCHELPDPTQHAAPDWVAVVRRMNGHMQTILGKTLSADQMSHIVLYLEKASASKQQ